MNDCAKTQETIARGEPLGQAEHGHLLACGACSALAAEYSLLEASLAALGHAVPSDFADRVMARIAAEPVPGRWFDRPWLVRAVAYAGGAIALANIARFLSSTLIASVGLGGTP